MNCTTGAAAALVALGTALAACGADNADVAAAPSAVPSSAPAMTPGEPSPTLSPATPATKPWDSTGPSFGVDRARWPGTAEAAHALLKKLPRERGGERLSLSYSKGEEDSGPEAGAEYGQEISVSVAQEYLTTDLDESGTEQLFSANNLLAARFGLALGCAAKTYRGTLPSDPDYPVPAVTEKPLTKPVWFSCRVDGAEGDEGYRAHALGWTSPRTAWLVIAADEVAVRSLVTSLHDGLA